MNYSEGMVFSALAIEISRNSKGVDLMLLWLADYLSDFVRAFSVFQYLTLRSMVSAMTALLVVIIDLYL